MSNMTGGECLVTLQKELDVLLVKRDQMNAKIMARFHNGSATRSRTTTGNAAVGWVNEEIISIRSRLNKNKTTG